ncbi:hypothetical protein BH11MYX2_BH11MYX2_29210 [soil metagenome]
MNDEDDPLASVNLHVWQAPAPRPVDSAVLLNRMVAPAAPARRTKAIIGLLAAANVALVAGLIFVLARSEPPPVITAAAGGPIVDSGTRDALHRLEQQQAQLARQLVDVDQLKATIQSLSDRVQQCEAKTVTPVKTSTKPATRSDNMFSLEPTIEPTTADPPESLDRASIAAAVAAVRPAIIQCRSESSASTPMRVTVRVRVTPRGKPDSTMIEGAAQSVGRCVVREMNKARFPRTSHGGTFTYPFVFGLDLE